jgi:hypothetical protein
VYLFFLTDAEAIFSNGNRFPIGAFPGGRKFCKESHEILTGMRGILLYGR